MTNIMDQIINDKDLGVKLYLPSDNLKAGTTGEVVIKGYLENPFSVSASVNWTDKLFGNDYATQLTTLFGQMGKANMVFNAADTIKQYALPNPINFPLSFYVVTLDPDKAVQNFRNVNKLYEGIFPNGTVNSSDVTYHWGYKPVSISSLGSGNIFQEVRNKGTIGLTIGTWFRAYGLLLAGCKIDYSPEVVDIGNKKSLPLWMRIDVSLTTTRVPMSSEMGSLFVG